MNETETLLVLLPASALTRLTAVDARYPMMFQIRNKQKNRNTHCGVLEFSASPNQCVLPLWLMRFLLLNEGDSVQLQSAELHLGTFAKLQPQSVDFLEISDPKAVLERILGSFACLSANDLIDIDYNERHYELRVLETKPDEAIRIIDCDLQVDFAPPVGYQEPKKPRAYRNDFEKPIVNSDGWDEKFKLFGGIGSRVDGKAVKIDSPVQKELSNRKRGVPDRRWRLGKIKMIRIQQKADQEQFNAKDCGVKVGHPRTELE